ncbi:hypothetical protein PS726_01873 [Pseudomonas fluorescens]|nr:hypothetical protein PS647_01264 [Pseudomonas fluorescens]VVN90931.1 hypothetical protein PS726_01873 [Pseudomonas fluorescens]VVO57134.1 hypothetical protein PS843_00586 [Pseudomonas fluorescens]
MRWKRLYAKATPTLPFRSCVMTSQRSSLHSHQNRSFTCSDQNRAMHKESDRGWHLQELRLWRWVEINEQDRFDTYWLAV